MSLQSIYKIKKNDHFTLSLTSLSTAGFIWSFEIENKDIIVIKQVENQKSTPEDAVGKSADEKFEIIGKNKGSTKIMFFQRRPWETDHAENAKKSTTVIVE